ncbi:flagellar motor switch protein FliN/FliY [Pullulanibacillus pueri]|uniref:Flagellar motor switch phosphatase FliY n=1 Tax=Pullulanibacillus pueri TaxID=1437324 RepID=A0A8J2ZVW0_9BACL|nr:flagellar motor switch phosphatase FliY [Pullulanibacillus pueri]MBM7682487.1 flagellar motor switch protein FliN/FliY [Pullulanibacillus pueri]GGH82202.1 flagellar motor switch phosphatase FliY [Pullulanibacillus pueri]
MTQDDGMLSQEEIDALLNGVDIDEPAQSTSEQGELNVLSPIEKDTLGEIGNISFSNAATALSTLLNQKVEITTPEISYITQGQLNNEFPFPHVSVLVNYTEGFKGSNVLLIKREDASVIADLMLGGDGTHPQPVIDEIQLSAVQEAMNQMMGSSATSMSTMFEKRVDISPPVAEILDMEKEVGMDTIPSHESFVKVSFRLKIGNLVDSSIMQLVPIDFAKALVAELTSIHESQQSGYQEESVTAPQETVSTPSNNQETHNNNEAIKRTESTAFVDASTKVQSAAFTEFDDVQPTVQSRNIDLLLDVPLTVTVELGRTRKRIKDILELGPGSVIELEKLAGEPVDVLINEKPIAKGEVVVIDENFGVRITEIINQRDRLQKL